MHIRANGIDIHYTIDGTGPWVTLSHSLACNLSMWDEQLTQLSRDYQVLRYDTRGHGQSGAPAGPYTLEQMADDAQALFEALGIRRTHWVGLSMGGMIGQVHALKYPGVFESLTLCDTTSRYPDEAAPLWEERIHIAETRGMDPIVEPTLARWFTDRYRHSRPDTVERVATMIRTTPVSGYVGSCAAIPQINVTEQLHKLKLPALVIVGEQDPATPPAMAREIHSALPGSELVMIPSAAHLSNIEQPEAFNEAVLSFLQRAAHAA